MDERPARDSTTGAPTRLREEPMIRDQRVAVIGAGKMGEALVRGLLDAGVLTPDRIRVTSGSGERARLLAAELGVVAAASNRAGAEDADLLLLAVEAPQAAPAVGG